SRQLRRRTFSAMPLPPVMQTNSCKSQTQKRRQDKYQYGTRISHCLTRLIFCRFLWLYRPSCGAAWATSVERHASHPDSRRAERRLTPKMRACSSSPQRCSQSCAHLGITQLSLCDCPTSRGLGWTYRWHDLVTHKASVLP